MKHYNLSAFAITVYATFAASLAFAASPVPLNLGLAWKYVILAGSGITNSRMSTIIGDVAISPAGRASIVGLGTDEVTGKVYAADDFTSGVKENLAQAKSDLAAAMSDAVSRTADTIPLSGNIGGQTLAPGLYASTGDLELSSGDLTLDGKGDPNAIWIFKISGSFKTTIGRTIALTGGAQAQNIYWQVSGSATIGSGAIFRGILMAEQSIDIGAVARLDGRALAKNGSVTTAYNLITEPTDAPAVAPASSPAVSTTTIIPAASSAPAVTASADTQLAALLAQLTDLQKQVAQAPAAVPAVKTEVAAPAKTAAGEMKKLQMFLNTHGFVIAESGPGSSGKETNTFGGLTKKALCKFQVDRSIVASSKSSSCGVYGPKTKQVVREMGQ